MSTLPSTSPPSKPLQPGQHSIHSELLKQMTPGWLIDAGNCGKR